MIDGPRAQGDRGFLPLVDLLDFAIEQANDGIAIMRFTGDPELPIRIVYANAAIERLSGFTRKELLDPGNPFLRAQPQNRARYDELFAEIRAGRPVRFEIELSGKDRRTWAEIRWSPLRYKGGEVTHYVAVLRDISERRRLALFESILAETSDFIIVTDGTPSSRGGPRITYANAAFGTVTGLQVEGVLEQPLMAHVSKHNDATTLATFASRLELGEAVALELRLRHRDRTDRWIELTGQAVRGEGDRIVSWLFVGKDIGVRKRSYAQTAQLTTALDLAEQPIAIYSVTGRAAVELLHMNTRAAALGRTALERMLDDPSERRGIEDVWSALERGETVTHRSLELRPIALERGALGSIIAIEHAP